MSEDKKDHGNSDDAGDALDKFGESISIDLVFARRLAKWAITVSFICGGAVVGCTQGVRFALEEIQLDEHSADRGAVPADSARFEEYGQRIDHLADALDYHKANILQREEALGRDLQKQTGRLRECERDIALIKAEIANMKQAQIAAMAKK